MSFQTPPPGGNQPPPPPPPPGQWGPPPTGGYQSGGHQGNRPGFDPKTVSPLDWAILGIGAIIFIFSFFDYYSVDFGFGYSASTGGWHFSEGTFLGWFAMVLSVLAAVAVALELFVPTLKLPVSARLAAVGLFAVSFLLYFIGLFAMTFTVGEHGFSYWLSLVLALAGAVLALMRAQQTGTSLPGALNNMPSIGQRGPQGGVGAGSAGPGYGAPASQPGYGAPAGPPPGYGAPAMPPPGYGTPAAPPPEAGSTPPPPGYGPQ